MAMAFIGLGSNLNNRSENICNALKALKLKGVTILSVSEIIETEPVGYFDQPNFLNGVCKIQTDLSPKELLYACHKTEEELGRVRSFANAPRIIDLDILLYDNIQMEEDGLIIPHPRMWERDFVVHPLKQIAPEIVEAHHADH